MTNNDVLRSLRYTFDFRDSKMIELCSGDEEPVSISDVSDWLKSEEHQDFKECSDHRLAVFLNALIEDFRGIREGPRPSPEWELNNNLVFRKLRIALNLKDEDILKVLESVDYKLGKHELSAFFRKPDHKNFRKCKDQILRNFLKGLREKYRPS